MTAILPDGGAPLKIARADYDGIKQKHLFLAGDLRHPCAHPFFRDARFEMILCEYAAGDDGVFHWHEAVTEYEIILDGRIGYIDAASEKTHWYDRGDVSVIPPGVCVRRLVPSAARTLALKLPSSAQKTQCRKCPRQQCPSRSESYSC